MDENTKDTTESTYLPVVENQKLLDKAVFQLRGQIRDSYRTGYNYWLYFKKKFPTAKFRPLLGRKVDDQFQIYDIESRGWINRDMYKDYGYDMLDNDGNVMMNDYGKPKRGTYIDQRKEYLVTFTDEMPIEVYNKDTKTKEIVRTNEAWIRISRGLANKLEETVETLTSAGFDRDKLNLFVDYDESKPLNERYKVKLHKE